MDALVSEQGLGLSRDIRKSTGKEQKSGRGGTPSWSGGPGIQDSGSLPAWDPETVGCYVPGFTEHLSKALYALLRLAQSKAPGPPTRQAESQGWVPEHPTGGLTLATDGSQP